MATIPVLHKKGIPTIFGDLQEKNVTFLVDTSGSMYTYLDVVKEHLVEALLTRASQRSDTMFNIIEFSEDVSPWADRLVKCSPQTVTVASQWIDKLTAKTGTNTLDALLAGLSDTACEALYLVTDGLPDQEPALILQHVAQAARGRPVHCVYLTGPSGDAPAFDFLEDLAVQSRGTFHLICVSRQGGVESVQPVVRRDHAQRRLVGALYVDPPPPEKVTTVTTSLDNPPVASTTTYLEDPPGAGLKTCSVTTSLDFDPYRGEYYQEVREPATVIYHNSNVTAYPHVAWETYRPPVRRVRTVVTQEGGLSATAGAVIQGLKVLARRNEDGHYYSGTIKQQVAVHHKFLVEFDQPQSGTKLVPRMQETAVYDIISYDDCSRHSVQVGDKVLAPLEQGGTKYAPGTVLEGVEGRISGSGSDTESTTVTFVDGRTQKVARGSALYLPPPLFERIQLEINMSPAARQHLLHTTQYPARAPPGYPTSGVLIDYPSAAVVTTLPRPPPQQPLYVPLYPTRVMPGGALYVVPPASTTTRESAVKGEEVEKLIPGTSLTKRQLSAKVARQLHQYRAEGAPKSISFAEAPPLSGRDSGVESGTSEDAPPVGLDTVDWPAEDLSLDLDDLRAEEKSTAEVGVGTDPALLYPAARKSGSLHQRPPWKYWPRSPPQYTKRRPKSAGYAPFRETALEAPLSARGQPFMPDPQPATGVSRPPPAPPAANSSVQNDRAQMEWWGRQPKPPSRMESALYSYLYSKVPAKDRLGARDILRQARERANLERHQQQAAARETSWKERDAERDRQYAARDQQFRQLRNDQIMRDWQRQNREAQIVQRAQEVKRATSAAILKRQQEHAQRQVEREQQKVQFVASQRDRRDTIRHQREQEIQDTIDRRREIKQQKQEQYWQSHREKMEVSQAESAAHLRQRQAAQQQRVQYFQQKEASAQERKDLRIAVKEMTISMQRSQIIP